MRKPIAYLFLLNWQSLPNAVVAAAAVADAGVAGERRQRQQQPLPTRSSASSAYEHTAARWRQQRPHTPSRASRTATTRSNDLAADVVADAAADAVAVTDVGDEKAGACVAAIAVAADAADDVELPLPTLHGSNDE